MKLLDTDHPFFRPLWIRVAIVLFTAAWTAFEVWSGSLFWACLVGVFTVLSFYGFFIDFDPDGNGAGKRDDKER